MNRPHRSRLTAVAAVTAAILALSGCAAQAPTASGLPRLATDTGSSVRGFGSLTELAGQASAVLLVHGTGEIKTVTISGADFQIVTVAVDKMLAGSVDGQTTLTVHTFAVNADTNNLLLSGPGPFIVFAKPFYTEIGKSTGEWTPTGDASGIFAMDTDGMYRSVDPDAKTMPAIDLDHPQLPKVQTAQFIIQGGDQEPA